MQFARQTNMDIFMVAGRYTAGTGASRRRRPSSFSYPERAREGCTAELGVPHDLVRRTGADADIDDSRVAEREGDSCSRERGAVALADRGDARRAVDQLAGGRPVVVARGGGRLGCASSPLLKTPAATTPTPRSIQTGSRSSSADWSRSV